MNHNAENQPATTLLPDLPVEDVAERALMHRPSCPAALAAEARRLAAQGLKPNDLAPLLGLTPPAVEMLLKEAA